MSLNSDLEKYNITEGMLVATMETFNESPEKALQRLIGTGKEQSLEDVRTGILQERERREKASEKWAKELANEGRGEKRK